MKTPDQIAAETASAVAMANRLWIWIAFLSLFLALSLLSNVTLIYNAFWRMPIKQFLWTADGGAVCPSSSSTILMFPPSWRVGEAGGGCSIVLTRGMMILNSR